MTGGLWCFLIAAISGLTLIGCLLRWRRQDQS